MSKIIDPEDMAMVKALAVAFVAPALITANVRVGRPTFDCVLADSFDFADKLVDTAIKRYGPKDHTPAHVTNADIFT